MTKPRHGPRLIRISRKPPEAKGSIRKRSSSRWIALEAVVGADKRLLDRVVENKKDAAARPLAAVVLLQRAFAFRPDGRAIFVRHVSVTDARLITILRTLRMGQKDDALAAKPASFSARQTAHPHRVVRTVMYHRFISCHAGSSTQSLPLPVLTCYVPSLY